MPRMNTGLYNKGKVILPETLVATRQRKNAPVDYYVFFKSGSE
jgi:hypothetical protein